MNPTAWIKSLTFKTGLQLTLKKNSIVAIVGPNNSGKSKLLKEMLQLIKTPKTEGLVLQSLAMTVGGTALDFLQKIEHRRIGDAYMGFGTGVTVSENNLVANWDRMAAGNESNIASIANFFVNWLDTAHRLNLVNPANNIDFTKGLRTHPIHTLKEDSTKELLFSDFFNRAFGQDVIINHGAGGIIPLHVGKRPPVTAEQDRVSTHYQQMLRQLPVLHEQGDGMKSFAGVLLSLFAENWSVNLIDEPEAFLHPPQAALLAQMTAQFLNEDKQLLVATHSEHFLKGLLESGSDRLIIVRIQRTDTDNSIQILENKELKDIWTDPLVRHSNILDGLFHKKVVLAETDSECRFYNAVTTAMIEDARLPSPDILFVSSGGKQRFPIIIRALTKLQVPLTVIGNYDFYNNENLIRNVYEAQDGNWDNVKADFIIVKKAMDEKQPQIAASALKKIIDAIFASFSSEKIPGEKIEELNAALLKSSPWSDARNSGKVSLPPGEATMAFTRLQQVFNEKNIYILGIDKIEAFDKSIDQQDSKWVNKVLEKDILHDPDWESVRHLINSSILKT